MRKTNRRSKSTNRFAVKGKVVENFGSVKEKSSNFVRISILKRRVGDPKYKYIFYSQIG